MNPTHLLLIDDHALFRSGIAMVLSAGLKNVSLLEAASLAEALALTEAPRMVLLDLQLQGTGGLEGISLLHAHWPDTLLVVVSASPAEDMADLALARGALAFISKTEPPQHMLSLVARLLGLEAPSAAPHDLLTPRQVEVLELLYRGLSNKMIGRQLGLSENTVRGHVQALLAALNVSSRSEAAFQARRLGLVQ